MKLCTSGETLRKQSETSADPFSALPRVHRPSKAAMKSQSIIAVEAIGPLIALGCKMEKCLGVRLPPRSLLFHIPSCSFAGAQRANQRDCTLGKLSARIAVRGRPSERKGNRRIRESAGIGASRLTSPQHRSIVSGAESSEPSPRFVFVRFR